MKSEDKLDYVMIKFIFLSLNYIGNGTRHTFCIFCSVQHIVVFIFSVQFNESAANGQGAMCNRIIMFLTDGGTEMPEEVFQKYNWPDKPVRIEPFSHCSNTAYEGKP